MFGLPAVLAQPHSGGTVQGFSIPYSSLGSSPKGPLLQKALLTSVASRYISRSCQNEIFDCHLLASSLCKPALYDISQLAPDGTSAMRHPRAGYNLLGSMGGSWMACLCNLSFLLGWEHKGQLRPQTDAIASWE